MVHARTTALEGGAQVAAPALPSDPPALALLLHVMAAGRQLALGGGLDDHDGLEALLDRWLAALPARRALAGLRRLEQEPARPLPPLPSPPAPAAAGPVDTTTLRLQRLEWTARPTGPCALRPIWLHAYALRAEGPAARRSWPLGSGPVGGGLFEAPTGLELGAHGHADQGPRDGLLIWVGSAPGPVSEWVALLLRRFQALADPTSALLAAEATLRWLGRLWPGELLASRAVLEVRSPRRAPSGELSVELLGDAFLGEALLRWERSPCRAEPRARYPWVHLVETP